MGRDGIVVLSCFDGISCGQVALERAGIKVAKYYASEVDKYAIKITQKNYPDTIQLGDIQNWKKWRKTLPIPDLIIAGSPCQGFSLAGKGLNFDDPRSKLFFTFLDILKYYQKKNKKLKFLLENVKMKKEWKNTISDLIGIKPVLINSALVSAQNRQRLYWANFPITQPEDKGIYLRDIIENGEVDRDKSYCIDANYYKGGNIKRYTTKGSRQLVKLPTMVQGAALRNQRTKNGTEARVDVRKDGKSNCVVSAYPKKLNGLMRIGTAVDIKGHDYNKRIYSVNGKAPSLAGKSGGNLEPKVALDTEHYRNLTVVECERLQTLKDGHTEGVSSTQRYKSLGNAWTVDVIVHILQGANLDKSCIDN